MGRESDRRSDLMVSWPAMPRSPGHIFYDRLQEVLIAGGFDLFAQTACQPYSRRRWVPRRCRPGTCVARFKYLFSLREAHKRGSGTITGEGHPGFENP